MRWPDSAIGFDWTNTDGTGDAAQLIIASEGFANTFGPGGGSGFFGVVSDTPGGFSVALFADTAGGGGVLGRLNIDNIDYALVPEPSSLALLGLGLLGLARRRRRA